MPTPAPTTAATLDVQKILLDSPATRASDYDLIGRLTLTPANGSGTTYRTISPGEFAISSDRRFVGDPFNYTLKAAAGVLPGNLTSLTFMGIFSNFSWDINLPPAQSYRYDNPYGDWRLVFGERLTAFSKAPDGTATQFLSDEFTRATVSSTQSLGSGQNLQTTLDYDMGYSYVAMGEWSWRVVDLNGAAAGDFGDLLFVQGDRTPASGIPASGTATYDARSLALLSSAGTTGIPFTLTADFGQRTMSALIDQNYRYDPTRPASADPILGIHVSGSAPFTNSGTFDIPLTGSANYSNSNAIIVPPSEPVTGAMNGAFFGPQAQQVGGVFSVNRTNGTSLMQDAFVGKQRNP